MKIIGRTQNKNLKRNDAHKTCFTVLITNFRKCPDSVTAGSASCSRKRDLAGFVSQAVVDDLNHQYLYSLPETSGITVQYIM